MEPSTSTEAELQLLNISELQARALDLGVAQETLDAADSTEDVKSAVIGTIPKCKTVSTALRFWTMLGLKVA